MKRKNKGDRMGDTRNPLDVLGDADDGEVRSIRRKKGSKQSFAPDWELVLPNGKIFFMKDKDTPTIILVMRSLIRDYEKQNFILRRKRGVQMKECDWEELVAKPKSLEGRDEQVKLLLGFIKQKMEEKKDGRKKLLQK
ncbi:MAG: hypothetical protein Q7U04_01555 [Bacteriovorax sp.]|nr:hypothetical protein [Bacteriovorax sp.]